MKLLDHKADASLRDHQGNLPIHLAAAGGWHTVVAALIAASRTADPPHVVRICILMEKPQ
jgi:ankyrin repeat protein